MLVECGGPFFDVFRAKHPDRFLFDIWIEIQFGFDHYFFLNRALGLILKFSSCN